MINGLSYYSGQCKIILEMFKLDGPFLNHLDFDLELKQL